MKPRTTYYIKGLLNIYSFEATISPGVSQAPM